MNGRRWTQAVLVFMITGLLIWPANSLAQIQQKGTGATGGITGGTGSTSGTGGTKDIEDEEAAPGSSHPKTSPQGWGRFKGKPPKSSSKQGLRGMGEGSLGAEAQRWEAGRRGTGKGPITTGGTGAVFGQEQAPPPKSPKGPKGPKGPNLPPAAPEAGNN